MKMQAPHENAGPAPGAALRAVPMTVPAVGLFGACGKIKTKGGLQETALCVIRMRAINR